MSFVYPAGLLALLGVGVLILVALLRRKYEETTLSSTYLWRLAQRYQKQNQTVQRLKKALVFALEMICIVLAAMLIAQPVITLPGADTGYVAILDGSGSMRIAGADGKTRFDRAKEAILSDAEALPWGSRITVILSGDDAQIAAQNLAAGDVRAALESVQCGFGAGDLTGAMALCQQLFDAGEGTQASLYTDSDAPQAENLAVIDVRGEGEWNVSVSSIEDEGSIYGTAFTADVVSDGRDASVGFELYLNGEKQDEEKLEFSVNGKKQEGGTVFCPAGETVQVSVLVRQAYSFSDVRICALAEDGLAQDNEYRLYAKPEKTTRVLLVGENAYFLERALSVFDSVDLTQAKTLGDAALEGYDVYVLDGCLPDDLPQDGAVWLMNPPRSPRRLGIVFGEALVGAPVSPVREWDGEDYSALVQDLAMQDAALVRFREVTEHGEFAPVLLCGKMPALLAGRSQEGFAQLVMPFDLHDSNLPLLSDYIVLMRNMLDFSAPPMLSAQDFACGEAVYPKVMARCEKLFLQTPDMTVRIVEENEREAGVRLTTPGGYTLLQELTCGEERILSFFAHMPKDESRIEAAQSDYGEQMISLRLPDEEETVLLRESVREDQQVNPLRMLAAALLALMCLEWVVYHREKY